MHLGSGHLGSSVTFCLPIAVPTEFPIRKPHSAFLPCLFFSPKLGLLTFLPSCFYSINIASILSVTTNGLDYGIRQIDTQTTWEMPDGRPTKAMNV